MLFDLIGRLWQGEEIIFADEVGPWMIGVDEKELIKCYLISLAKIATTKEFVDHVIPLIKRDSYESFSNKVYKNVIVIASKEQKLVLKEEVIKCEIKIA